MKILHNEEVTNILIIVIASYLAKDCDEFQSNFLVYTHYTFQLKIYTTNLRGYTLATFWTILSILLAHSAAASAAKREKLSDGMDGTRQRFGNRVSR